jgi:O-glycosyl hydrolase
MKRAMRSLARFPAVTALIGACWVSAAIGDAFAGTEPLRIRIDTGTSYQTIDGFGASDAWQCAVVGKNWPLAKREQIADLLFSQGVDSQDNPKGIGLSVWRFNVGAGTAEQGDASDIRNPWRRTECFQNPDGSYDWSRQAGQQWFLKAALTLTI